MPSIEYVHAFATIAATAVEKHGITVPDALRFASYSCASVGDASCSEDDFDRHFAEWLVANELSWRRERAALAAAVTAVDTTPSYADLLNLSEFRRVDDLIRKAEDVDDIYR